MDGIKMTIEEMISKLDGACGRLLAMSMKNKEVREAMEMVTSVSITLGEIEEIRHRDYTGLDDDE